MGARGLDYTAVRCRYNSANSPSAHVGNMNHDHRKLRFCFGFFLLHHYSFEYTNNFL